jgi:16S rRNA (guanine527-N7)-methyltransferase
MIFVSRETLEDRKAIYYDLLRKWNKSYNLVQQNTLKDFDHRHWDDSIQIAEYIANDEKSILDIGSGAGFPGLVLASAGYLNVTLCEIGHKKREFLKEAARQLNVKAEIENDCYVIDKTFDFVVSRAFSELRILLEVQNNVSRETNDTIGLYLKGEKHLEEIRKAQEKWAFDFEIFPSKTSEKGVILEIRKVEKK